MAGPSARPSFPGPRASLLVLLVLSATVPPGCAAKPLAAPEAPAARATGARGLPTLEQLADEIDPGPQKPVWPQMPDATRYEIEKTVFVPAGAEARVAEAAKRLEHVTLDLETGQADAWSTRLRGALEGLYLAEPVALGPAGPAQARAAALLERFYAMTSFLPKAIEMYLSFARLGGPETARKAERSTWLTEAVARALGQAGGPMQRRLAAGILRSGEPKEAVPRVLSWLSGEASSRGDHARSLALQAEAVARRGEAAGWEDHLALARAAFRALDVEAGDRALARALPAGTTPEDTRESRRRRAEVARARWLRAPSVLLASPPGDGSVAARVARLDAQIALGRGQEARAEAAALAREAPRDARVRTRLSLITFDERAESGDVVGAADAAGQVLEGPVDPATLDADYYGFAIALFGVRTSAQVVPMLARDPGRVLSMVPELVAQLRRLAEGHASGEPGRAAVLLFALDQGTPLIDLARAERFADVARAVQGAFVKAVAIRDRFPKVADAHRLVFALAFFAEDRPKALSTLAEPLPFDPFEETELFEQRAEAMLGLAAATGDEAGAARALRAAEELPGGLASDEAKRSLLRADALAVLGVLRGEKSSLARAEEAYAEALSGLPRDRRARVLTNQGMAALGQGDGASAKALLRAALDEPSGRAWVSRMDLLFAAVPEASAAERLEGLRQIAFGERASDGSLPPALLAAMARLERSSDPRASAEHAARALEAVRAPSRAMRPDGSARGIETEGSFQISLGASPRRRTFVLRLGSGTVPWLMPKVSLDPAELEALARPADREAEPKGAKGAKPTRAPAGKR